MDRDSLGDRMKQYEQAYRTTLPRRMPVIIRVDGKSFHTLTRGCDKPFDKHVIAAMDEVAKALCEEVQGAQLAYVQSDEVSVLVHGYKTINSQPWFNNELQKMVSVSASAATAAFNRFWRGKVHHWLLPLNADIPYPIDDSIGSLITFKGRAPEVVYLPGTATFDARVFLMPEDEVCNYFIWRQQDASRNSVQMVARANFSHKECDGLDCNELQEKLFQEKQINWNDLPTSQRRGRCVVRESFEIREWTTVATRYRWVVDDEIPIFTADRNYIDKHVYIHRTEAA